MAAPRGTEILNVLMPMFSGDKDEYGKDVVPALPLNFDLVNGGRPPRSNAPLFQLPVEILGIILEQIEWESLAALALVNHDCLQLARSRQFVSIKLDYSDASLGIIDKLQAETRQRMANAESVPFPSLGACIRRVTVATHPGWVTQRHGISLSDENFSTLPEDERTRLMVGASANFFQYYVPRISVLLNHSTTPHLELLDWEDMICLPRSFYESLALSPVKHLKLFRVNVDQEFRIELPEAPRSDGWPLQTLHLELCTNLHKIGKVSTVPLATSILRLCASTLRNLTLNSLQGKEPFTFLNQDSQPSPCFASLRHLTLGNVRFEDPSMLEAFVTDNVRTLNVDTERSPASTIFFQNRGTIRNLETFAWETFNIRADHPLDFVRANPQLLALAIPKETSSTLLDLTLLPLLSQSFLNLRSLSLVWQGVSVSEIALETISTLKALEQLHLSSGNQYGWRHDWHINHGTMREHLSRLPLLRKVAFSRDTYHIVHSDHPALPAVRAETYYESRILTRNEYPDNPNDNDMVWEEKHRSRMLREADAYVRVLPNLEWLYFGQIPMRIKRTQGSDQAVVTPLSQERDSCWTLLRTMFGGERD